MGKMASACLAVSCADQHPQQSTGDGLLSPQAPVFASTPPPVLANASPRDAMLRVSLARAQLPHTRLINVLQRLLI
jgi:hypothetical protein